VILTLQPMRLVFFRVYLSTASLWFSTFRFFYIFLITSSQNIAFALKFPSSKERSKSYSFKSARKMKRTPSSSITTTKKNGIGVGVGKESKEEDKRERDETTKSAILSIKGLPGFTKLYPEVSWIYFLMSRSHHRSNAITFIQTIPRFSKR